MSERIGVVIPSYNHGRFINAAIDSALSQTRPPDRVVVVDDGSTDDTRERLERLSGDQRVTVLWQQNQGADAALNRGITEVGTDLVFLLNSDDRFAPQRIEQLSDLLKRRPAVGLAGTWLEVVDEAGARIGVKEAWHNLEPWKLQPKLRTFQGTPDPRANLLQTNYLSTSSNFALRREVWERHGPFRPLRYAHDWDLALRIARQEEIAVLPRPLLQYRVHAGNTIRSDRRGMEFEILWVMAANLPSHLEPERETAFLHRLLCSFPDVEHPRVLSLLLAIAAADGRNGQRRLESLLNPEDPLRRCLLEEMR
jgi:glycosyltransferase involved in cell wall biosynthesis